MDKGQAIFPILGSFYRPPAKAILAALPVGAALELRPEPDNHIDPNAIAVWVRTSAIPERAHKKLVLSGADCGFRIGEEHAIDEEDFLFRVLLPFEWHLGYIPASEAKRIHLPRSIPGRFCTTEGKNPFCVRAALSAYKSSP